MSTEKEKKPDGECAQFRMKVKGMVAEPSGTSLRTSATLLSSSQASGVDEESSIDETPRASEVDEESLLDEKRRLLAEYASLAQAFRETLPLHAHALVAYADELERQQREHEVNLKQMDAGLSAISCRVHELVATTERAAVATCNRFLSHRCNVALGAPHYSSLHWPP